MTPSELAATVCARLAHHYGPAADAGAAVLIQRELETAIQAAVSAALLKKADTSPPAGYVERDLFTWTLGFNSGRSEANATDMTTEQVIELREAAYDYAHLIQVERYDRDDIAVHRAYERLRKVLGHPVGLASKPYVVPDDRLGESRSYSRENTEG